MNLEFSLDLAKLSRADTLNTATDTGGIAGYSSGAIASSTNYAAVGYQHIGYNVGGVVGRSSGQILACSNEGAVCGRKDVGGIAGQMEPYVRTQVSASQLSRIQSQIKELDSLVKKAVNDAEYGSSEISDRLDLISGYLSDASDAANDVTIDVDPDAIPSRASVSTVILTSMTSILRIPPCRISTSASIRILTSPMSSPCRTSTWSSARSLRRTVSSR